MEKIFNLIKDKKLLTFAKFATTGIANTLIDFLVYTLLISLFSLNIYVSQVIGYCSGMVNSYLINRTWTFNSKEKFFSSELFKFIFTNLLMLAVSLILLKFATETLLLNKLFAKLFATAITLCINFVVTKLWVFKSN